jgi:hypothetical protein
MTGMAPGLTAVQAYLPGDAAAAGEAPGVLIDLRSTDNYGYETDRLVRCNITSRNRI